MTKNRLPKRSTLFTKRFLDTAAVLVTAPITIPLGAVMAVLVRIFMGRPVFFKQERVGKDDRVFEVLKFRSMLPEIDADGNTLEETERHTRFGTFLRRASLDEIPQLINVVRGEMSIVGPRPLPVDYLPYFTEEERIRHSMRPGITGAAQVRGRNRLNWDEKLALDVNYAKTATLRQDLDILVRTVFVVIRREGILPDAADETEGLDTYRTPQLHESAGALKSGSQPPNPSETP
ncbi:sugar transferase [Corynebacterium sp. S7]